MSDNKSFLNQYCQKRHIPRPEYKCDYSSDGFSCTVSIEGTHYNSLSTHSVKKDAEKDAASVAVENILQLHPTARVFDDVLKSLDFLSISGAPKNLIAQQTTDSALIVHPTTAEHGTKAVGLITPPHPTTVLPPPGLHVMQSPPRATTNHSLISRPPPLVKRTDMPISIEGPSISRPTADKPSSAISVSPKPLQPPPPVSTLPSGVGGATRTSDKDTKDLELYCQMSSLPTPVYTIYQERGRHFGRVQIGEMEFSRGWGYEKFDDAKDSAAVVAIAGLAMIQLRLLAQQGVPSPRGGPLPFIAATIPPSVQQPSTVQNIPFTPPSQATQSPQASHLSHRGPSQASHPSRPNLTLAAKFSHSLKQSHPHTFTPPPQANSLQTPSYFQQPIPRGASTTGQTTPTLQKATPTLQQSAMAMNYKSLLNTHCQKHHFPAPVYVCTSPDDSTGYVSTVDINGDKFTSSVHGTKRAADTDAARLAAERLGLVTGVTALTLGSGTNDQQNAAPVTTNGTDTVIISYKNLLQERAQKDKQSLPHYALERTEGGFVSTVTVYVANGPSFQVTSSAHPVKKAAEQEAAKLACHRMNLV